MASISLSLLVSVGLGRVRLPLSSQAANRFRLDLASARGCALIVTVGSGSADGRLLNSFPAAARGAVRDQPLVFRSCVRSSGYTAAPW